MASTPAGGREVVLLNSEDVRRAIVRIAHEILEAHKGSHDLVLIGMRTRGVPLARRLAELMAACIKGTDVKAEVNALRAHFGTLQYV